MREVVVTGVGAITPLGVGARTLHERWTAGDVGIQAGEGACEAFDPLEFCSRKQARRADRFTQLALGAAAEALAEAGWTDGPPYAHGRVGCILGTGIGGIGTLESNVVQLNANGPGAVAPLAVPLMMSNAGAAAIAMQHDLRGPVFGVVSACAAGANAIGAALEALSPTGVSRPFDARRDGFVMGEGAGVLVLEHGASARARGARVLATVRGYGTTCDAHHLTAPRSDGAGAAAAIRAALGDAQIGPQAVDYVNAHGTSTPLNDRAETLALKAALGERAARVPVSSTKSAIGHLLGAAGAVEAIATILALRDRIAPPTLGLSQPDPELDLDYVPHCARALETASAHAAIGISNSFGFGGHNAVLVLEAA